MPQVKKCAFCQCDFTPYPKYIPIQIQKFCSPKCRKKAQIERMKIKKALKPKIYVCLVCGEKFGEYSRVCSDDCSALYLVLRNLVNAHNNKRGLAKTQAFTQINGDWIAQPLELALENQKKGHKIFTYDDFMKFKERFSEVQKEECEKH